MSVSTIFLESIVRRVDAELQRRFLVNILFRLFVALIVLGEWAVLLLYPAENYDVFDEARVLLLFYSLVFLVLAVSSYWHFSNIVFSRRIRSLFNVLSELTDEIEHAERAYKKSNTSRSIEFSRILHYVDIGSKYEFEVRSGWSLSILIRYEPFIWFMFIVSFAFLGLFVSGVFF